MSRLTKEIVANNEITPLPVYPNPPLQSNQIINKNDEFKKNTEKIIMKTMSSNKNRDKREGQKVSTREGQKVSTRAQESK